LFGTVSKPEATKPLFGAVTKTNDKPRSEETKATTARPGESAKFGFGAWTNETSAPSFGFAAKETNFTSGLPKPKDTLNSAFGPSKTQETKPVFATTATVDHSFKSLSGVSSTASETKPAFGMQLKPDDKPKSLFGHVTSKPTELGVTEQPRTAAPAISDVESEVSDFSEEDDEIVIVDVVQSDELHQNLNQLTACSPDNKTKKKDEVDGALQSGFGGFGLGAAADKATTSKSSPQSEKTTTGQEAEIEAKETKPSMLGHLLGPAKEIKAVTATGPEKPAGPKPPNLLGPPSSQPSTAVNAFGGTVEKKETNIASSPFSTGMFGQANQATKPFGTPAETKKEEKPSAFGTPSFGETKTETKPAFSSPAFSQAKQEDKPSAFGTATSVFGQSKQEDKPSTFGTAASAFGQKSSAFGQSSSEAKPAFGATGFGQTAASAFGNSSPAPTFGQPSQMGQVASAFGSPATPAPAFGQPSALGTPAPAFGQPSPMGAASAFGQPSALGTSKPAFGQPSAFGAAPAFGQPTAFGAAKPAFGQSTGFGQAPVFGQAAALGSGMQRTFGSLGATGGARYIPSSNIF
jgi:hypothetical protein